MNQHMVLTIQDESTGTAAATSRLLTLATAKLTARELIRERVNHEVRQYNDSPSETFAGLVRLSDEELALNGEKPGKRLLDPQRQVARAYESFRKKGFALLVDSAQVESLDQELDLSPDSDVVFLRLYPLAGG